MAQQQRDIKRKLRALQHFEEKGSAPKASRYFGISRHSFYSWKEAYLELGE